MCRRWFDHNEMRVKLCISCPGVQAVAQLGETKKSCCSPGNGHCVTPRMSNK